jgi:hypothetical protein
MEERRRFHMNSVRLSRGGLKSLRRDLRYMTDAEFMSQPMDRLPGFSHQPLPLGNLFLDGINTSEHGMDIPWRSC